MSNIDEKKLVVNEIKDKLKNASSLILVNSRGLTAEQDTALRKKLREAEVFYKVYKNTMLKLAFKETQFESLSEYLAGPTCVAISYQDATCAARIISKEKKSCDKLEFKAGVIDGALYDSEGINTIANIPSREELLSKLLGSFKSPMASFARVIKAIAEKKEKEVA